jgi:3D (Asp-Asp-Asp) domain-containing protein
MGVIRRLSSRQIVGLWIGFLILFAVLDRPVEAACATFNVSAYTHTGNRTATGIYPYSGVVAVDPRVIPLGSVVWIAGYGEHLAADTGSGIRGFMLDRFVPSYREAIQFGRRVLEACW